MLVFVLSLSWQIIGFHLDMKAPPKRDGLVVCVQERFPWMHVHTLAYTFTEDSLNTSVKTGLDDDRRQFIHPSAPPAVGPNSIVQWAPIAVDQAYPLAAQHGPDMCV